MKLDEIKYDQNGLIPAIIQDADSGEVLMLAYMNREALEKSLETGRTHFWSRSRQKLWMKGETSGHIQTIVEKYFDCDRDTLLFKVKQTEAACHTGHYSCFFHKIDENCDIIETGKKVFDPSEVYNAAEVTQAAEVSEAAAIAQADRVSEAAAVTQAAEVYQAAEVSQMADAMQNDAVILQELYEVVMDRRDHPKEGSYTNYLFTKGLDKILKKVGEESAEVIIASKNRSKAEVTYEVSDLIYHLMVLLVEQGVTLKDIYTELRKRR